VIAMPRAFTPFPLLRLLRAERLRLNEAYPEGVATMPEPLTVNPMVTDAVTQSNVKVVGEAPAIAISTLYQTMAHSTGILLQNAVAAQQQQNTLAQAATNQGVMQIYSVDTMSGAGATEKVGQSGVADNLTSLLTVLQAFSGNNGGRG
jgi:hypothetical protein